MSIYSIEEIKKMPEPKRTEEMKKKYKEMLGFALWLAEDQGYTGPLFYKTSDKEDKKKENNNKNEVKK